MQCFLFVYYKITLLAAKAVQLKTRVCVYANTLKTIFLKMILSKQSKQSTVISEVFLIELEVEFKFFLLTCYTLINEVLIIKYHCGVAFLLPVQKSFFLFLLPNFNFFFSFFLFFCNFLWLSSCVWVYQFCTNLSHNQHI